MAQGAGERGARVKAFSVRSGISAHWAVVLALACLAAIVLGTVLMALAQPDLSRAVRPLVGGE